MFSCKRWTSTKFVRSELTVETLASPKHGKIIQIPCPKHKRNMTPFFWVDLSFEWSEDDMVFRVFSVIIFYLEPTVRKDAWMRTTSVTVMIIFFKKWNSQIYLITAILKVPSQQLRGTLTTDTLQSFILQTWINMLAKSFIKTSVNATETKIDESVWKKISYAKIEAFTWKCNFSQT